MRFALTVHGGGADVTIGGLPYRESLVTLQLKYLYKIIFLFFKIVECLSLLKLVIYISLVNAA